VGEESLVYLLRDTFSKEPVRDGLKAVELSVGRGVAGCVWTNPMSVTLSGAPLWLF
jgi:hypothetical protein